MAELPTNPDCLLTYVEVAKLIGIERGSLRRMVERGEFPPPIVLGRQKRWRWGTVSEYLRALEVVQAVRRKAARRGVEGAQGGGK